MKKITMIFNSNSHRKFLGSLEVSEDINEKEAVIDYILRLSPWEGSEIFGPFENKEDKTYLVVFRKDGKVLEVKFFTKPYNRKKREEAFQCLSDIYDELKASAREYIMSPDYDEDQIAEAIDSMVDAFNSNSGFFGNKSGNA